MAVTTLAPGLLYSSESDTLYVEAKRLWISCNGREPMEALKDKLLEALQAAEDLKYSMHTFKYREAWKTHLAEHKTKHQTPPGVTP
jgi:hypothetical protein